MQMPSGGVQRVLVVTLVTGLLTVSTAVRASQESYKIVPSDGGAENEFGFSVALDQGLLVVGARHDDDNGPESGSAYVYDALSGALVFKLTASDGAAGDEFGFSVAIDGGHIAIGALRDNQGGVTSGSVYLFDASTGAELAKLTPSDGADGDEFGHSVAIEGNLVAVGAKRDDDNGLDSGSAYLFSVSTGLQVDKLVPSDGAMNDNFGGAIAMDGGVVAIGAHADWDNGPLSGSAYLFDASTGALLFKLLADDGATNDFFGSSIDIDNGVVAVGAWSKSIVFDHSGAAYTFDASTGAQLARLVPSDTGDQDNFGFAISIDGGVVAVGARQDNDNGFDAGSAYLFDAFSNTQLDKLLASDGAALDYFGSSIASANGVVVVGSIGDQDLGNDTGSAYVFGTPSPDSFVRGDGNDDSVVNLADVIYALNYLFLSGPAVCADAIDSNDDGIVNLADAIHLINWLFVTGPGPVSPFPNCGPDGTQDPLTCSGYTSCP
ncbi:MAG: FG-GAP repeat protein [Planctomycetes bacterium]|nr:FG-GAP repeat protein [Planctomycetota bacterium]